MNCSWLAEVSSFDCKPVTGIHGEPGVEIGTPFAFADGTAIVFYAFEQQGHVLFSDNGDTLFHLNSIGMEPFKPRRLSAIRDIAGRHGTAITEEGDLRSIVPISRSRHQFAQTVCSLLAIAEWEREQTGLSEKVRNLADEAEWYLRAWKPHAMLARHPEIKGQSTKTHRFDYILGTQLIDVITPNHTATGAVMRKAGDVLNGPYLGDQSILVIIDDREDPGRAETERQIVGSLVSAMRFSTLT